MTTLMDEKQPIMNHSFSALQEEKAILERNRNDEISGEEPKLFGLLDSRSILMGYLMMGATGNLMTAMAAGPNLLGVFYVGYAAVTFVGLAGLIHKNAMMICIYSAFATATFIFSLLLDGQILGVAFDPASDLCGILLESSGSSKLTIYCHSHLNEVRWTVVGALLLQMGVDLMVLGQLYRVFNWVVDEDDRRENRIALKNELLV